MSSDIGVVTEFTSGIDDRLSDVEGELLYKLAKDVPSGQVIVEIGGSKGKSTVCLAKGTEAGQRNKVYSIGAQSASNDRADKDRGDARAKFLNNLTEAGVQDTVVAVATASEEAALRWRDKVGLLWVNASREYEDVKHIILSWGHNLSPRASLAFHGCDQPGPARVVKEHLGDFGNFIFLGSVDTTIVVAIDKCIHYWVIDSQETGICKCCGRKRNFKRISREASNMERRRRSATKGKK